MNFFTSMSGADPEIFERGGPEAVIYKILERGDPKSLKMAFECPCQSFSYKSFANIPPKGGRGTGLLASWPPPLNPPLHVRGQEGIPLHNLYRYVQGKRVYGAQVILA